MSREAVEAVVGKAVLDSQFRQALFANPEGALAEYDLSEKEVAALKAIDYETVESFAGTLDERISKLILFPLIDGVTSPEVGLSDHLAGERPQITSASGINLKE